jgi:transposase
MKKVSKMPTRLGETIGIDLGDKVSRYCIVDPDGEVMEEGSFRNQASSLEKHFGDQPRRIALEAGAQSAWISRELKRLGHEVIVAKSARVELDHRERRQKRSGGCAQAGAAGAGRRAAVGAGGTSDAEQQAELGRDPGARCDPAGTHAVDQQCPQHRQGVRCAPAQVHHRHVRQASHRGVAGVSAHGAQRIAGTDRRPQPGDRRLRPTDWRVGREASGTGAAGEHSRPRPAHRDDVRAHAGPRRAIHAQPGCGRFLGLRPKQRQSGARDPQLGISKAGDPYLRKLLVQCAHHILGHYGKDSALRRWGLAKGEGGKKATLRAIVAVARKLSVLLHRLWVSGEFYNPS